VVPAISGNIECAAGDGVDFGESVLRTCKVWLDEANGVNAPVATRVLYALQGNEMSPAGRVLWIRHM
jgi:hypothetical protein